MRDTINLSLPKKMREAVDAACRKESRSRSELIREALRRYLSQAEPEFYTPTKAELRTIEKARGEMKRGEYLTSSPGNSWEIRVRKRGLSELHRAPRPEDAKPQARLKAINTSTEPMLAGSAT